MADVDLNILDEADRKAYLAMSQGSWYFAADLAKLWGCSSNDAKASISAFVRKGVLRLKRVERNHNLPGAPSTVYSREDSWMDVSPNAVALGRAARELSDIPPPPED